jgi:hypothetical protein
MPETFKDAIAGLLPIIAGYPDLLITPEYSKDTKRVCDRCHETEEFRLADPEMVLSVLGYC